MEQTVARLIESEGLPADYAKTVDRFWRPLARFIADRAENDGPLLVGINGAQGAGKSTACLFLQHILEERHRLKTVILSLDDLYATRAEREAMARSVHPLFRTRGVPGTHDVALGTAVLKGLLAGKSVTLPRFDKSMDDRAEKGVPVSGPVDVVLFEGWCVGARPMPDISLAEPINRLEAEEDPDSIWRHKINEELTGEYARLFRMIDLLIMFRVPDFEHVRANRRRQEEKLAERSPDGTAIMGEEELLRFISHYERLTRFMLEEMPGRADVTFELDDRQTPKSLPAVLES
ncbi:kinase [Altericroceibacterium spongiae]|uniref:Kinase n=1 Tax=Altericroceibacterium spongiae TaxID=2320269 RepID=A0A420EKP5_9SPHN|nr:kinase [Altericroceibacterium spongiae]